MKLRANRADLADALAWVSLAVPKRPQMPALAGMRLSLDDDNLHDVHGLTMQAFDYDTGHTATLEVEAVDEGTVLAPALFVRDIVAAVKGAEIELVVDGQTLTISAGRSVYRTQVLALEDYPSLPDLPPIVGAVEQPDLARLVASVRYAIDDQHPNHILRALRLEGGHGLEAAGLTTSRVATNAVEWQPTLDEAHALMANVPVRALEAAVRGLSGTVSIGYDESLFGITDGARAVTMRTYAGDFPPWRTTLRDPAHDTFAVTVDPGELASAVRRAALVAEGAAVVLGILPDQVEVSVAGDTGGAGTDVVEASMVGISDETRAMEWEPTRVGVNPHYLADALAVVPDGLVDLGFQVKDGSHRALLVRPHDHPHMAAVVMPKKASM